MAKAKTATITNTAQTEETTTEAVTNNIEEKFEAEKTEELKQESKSGPTYNELLSVIEMLSNKITALEEGQAKASVTNNNSGDLTELLSMIANRRSDREVAIVHNCELNGGLTTHIDLSNMSIDFTHVGEERLLSWQQFEECVSKYRSFFERKIILLSDNDEDIAHKYNVPFVKPKGGNHVLSFDDMVKLPKMDVPELESFINSLSDKDKDMVFSYWMGKCYTRENGFYDRYKMDTLNRLSDGAFANILLVMNGDARASVD